MRLGTITARSLIMERRRVAASHEFWLAEKMYSLTSHFLWSNLELFHTSLRTYFFCIHLEYFVPGPTSRRHII